jgi:hypothetical protein
MNKYVIVFLISTASSLVMSMDFEDAIGALNNEKVEKTLSKKNEFEMRMFSEDKRKETASQIIVVKKFNSEGVEKKQKRLIPKVFHENYSAHSADFDISKQACSFHTYIRSNSDSFLYKEDNK